jgi:CDP-glycerol glycerophosphotransferase (TagB/SpsB family)
MGVASTKLEIDAMVENGIKKDNIVLAGSTRDDMLFDESKNKKNILIAPSWRGWLYNNNSLQDSEFYKNYIKLLSDKRLNNYLEENNIYLSFYLHHMFHKFYKEFKSYTNNRIKILEPNVDIAKYIRGSKLLITDYSSVCADFYYLRKPVIFFQFDKDIYTKKIGSYINLEKDKFGDVALDYKEVVDKLIDSVDKNYQISQLQKDGEKFFVNFVDRDNCKRVYNKIREKI